jgi:hypothetical protein
LIYQFFENTILFIDANSFQEVLGVVRTSRGVLYFCVLLHFYDQFFEVFLGGYMRCPPLPLCASMILLFVLKKLCLNKLISTYNDHRIRYDRVKNKKLSWQKTW